jgi:hypothetical protein
VIADNALSDVPFTMAGDGASSDIPGVLIRKVHGDTIRDKLGQGVSVALDAMHLFQTNIGADEVAGFSSRGPRSADTVLKPDIAAPGVAIDSAGVASGTAPRQMAGTSMACPMVAGGAALVRQARPAFTPGQVKAALMNSVSPLADDQGHPIPVSLGGSGRMRVDLAARRTATAAAQTPGGAVSLSFGSIVTAKDRSGTATLVAANHGTEPVTYQVSVEPTYPLAGTSLVPGATSLLVPPAGTASLELTLTVAPSSLPVAAPDPATPSQQNDQPRHFLTEAGGHVVLTDPKAPAGEALRVPYHAVVRAASERSAGSPSGCSLRPADPVSIPIGGPSAHPAPFVSAFELAALSPAEGSTPEEKLADLLAVGIATNSATAESFSKASAYFALAVAGEWTTPALGPLSLVGVDIDTDLDGKTDYVTYAEALSRDGPYADVLAATTYELDNGEIRSRRFLNILSRSKRNTEPFHNSVVILPVTLGDIGVAETKATFAFRAFTRTVAGFDGDETDWIRYDPAHPVLDTARGGEGGLPVYADPSQVKVFVHQAPADGGKLPGVLLLHHTNVAGKRFETLELAPSAIEPADLGVTQSAPSSVTAGTAVTVNLTVANAGKGTARGVALSASYAGVAAIAGAKADQGTCTAGAAVTCEIGNLAPGESATVTVTLQAGSSAIQSLVKVSAASDCEARPADDQVAGSIAVSAAPDAGFDAHAALDAKVPETGAWEAAVGAPPAVSPAADTGGLGGGACTCETRRSGAAAPAWWGAGLGLVAAAARRRRARAKPR